jgi:hypothetical protein
MPRPCDAKLGTRVHEDDVYEEEIPEVERCEVCNTYTDTDDLEECTEQCAMEYFGRTICYDCRCKVERIYDEWEKEAYPWEEKD